MKNAKACFHKKGENSPDHVKSDWSRKYIPETDIYPEILPTNATYFQLLIGVLQWIVELSRADIAMETSVIESIMVSSREGHIKRSISNVYFFSNQSTIAGWCLILPSLTLTCINLLKNIGRQLYMSNVRNNYHPMHLKRG